MSDLLIPEDFNRGLIPKNPVELGRWLRMNKVEEDIVKVISDNSITGADFLTLTDRDLKDLIPQFAMRKKLRDWIGSVMSGKINLEPLDLDGPPLDESAQSDDVLSLSGNPSDLEQSNTPLRSSTPLKQLPVESGQQLQPVPYSPAEMLQKSKKGTKPSKSQLYFKNLVRDCARQAKIWKTAEPLPSIPDAKLRKFFDLITTAVPQLAAHRSTIRVHLGQALQNKRKYMKDLETGKRKSKKRLIYNIKLVLF